MMLWSSFYPNQVDKIPNVGDRVFYLEQPHTITRRYVRSGNVLLDLGEISGVRLEVVEWFPEVGDVCRLALKPYLGWRKGYGDYSIPEWFWKKSRLIRVDVGGMAVVKRDSYETVNVVPFECLIVVEKEKHRYKS